MTVQHGHTGRRHFNWSLIAAAVASPMAALLGRPAFAQAKQEAPMPDAPQATKSDLPIDAMSEFLNGFHFYADDMSRQIEANHICTHLTEDFHQCAIYDSTQSNAKLIGIEYIVSERVFKSLPDEEKRLWHSHNYEVKSGELITTRMAKAADHAFMKNLVTTYGKTWHTWQIDLYPDFPSGIPQLMMGFTKDGQAKPRMVEDRDRRFGTDSRTLRTDRDDIPWPDVDIGANSWQRGTTAQLVLHECPVKNVRS